MLPPSDPSLPLHFIQLWQPCPVSSCRSVQSFSHSSHTELVPLLFLYAVVAQPRPDSWVGSSRKLRAGLTRLSTKDFSHLASRWLEEAAGWGVQGAGEHQLPAEAAALMGHACSFERCPLQSNKSVVLALTKENFPIQIILRACHQFILEGMWGTWSLYGYGNKIGSLPWAGSRAEHTTS